MKAHHCLNDGTDEKGIEGREREAEGEVQTDVSMLCRGHIRVEEATICAGEQSTGCCFSLVSGVSSPPGEDILVPGLDLLFKNFLFLLIQEWCYWPLLIYGEFRVGHEVVDGVFGSWVSECFHGGTVERFDHSDLHQGKEKEGEENAVVRTGQQNRGLGSLMTETSPATEHYCPTTQTKSMKRS